MSTMTMTVWRFNFFKFLRNYHHDSMTVIFHTRSYQPWQWQYDSYIFKFLTNYHHDSMTVWQLYFYISYWIWQYDSYSTHTLISTMAMTVWQLYFQIFIDYDHDCITVNLLIRSYLTWQMIHWKLYFRSSFVIKKDNSNVMGVTFWQSFDSYDN